MQSFFDVLSRDIERNHTTKTREYYEQTCATWLLKGYLTTEEVDKIILLLDQYYGPTV